jgi:hypothetical protein
VIIDLRRIEARHAKVGEEMREQIGPGLGQLIEDERAAGDLGQDREEAGAGGRLQDAIAGRDAGGAERGEAERDRCRELLKRLALLGPPCMGGKKARDLCELRQRRSHRAGLAEKRLAVSTEKQNRGRFAGVVACLPVPRAGRVGAAEGLLHCRAQDDGFDAPPLLDVGKKKPRGLGEAWRGSIRAGARDRRGCWCGRRGRRMRHEKRPRESGTRASRPALSLNRTGSNPSRPNSPSRHAAAFTARPYDA